MLLYILTEQKRLNISDEQILYLVKLLITFFVRRNITDIPNTRNLNKIFMDIIENIKKMQGEEVCTYIKNNLREVSASSSIENKERLMNCFYKEKLEDKLNKFVPEWEEKIGVKSNCYSIRKIKNKWGSCNTDKKEINFNLELAKKKDSEIQYVVIHELLHLIEKNHNDIFKRLMYEHCPKWEIYQDTLNEIL